MRQTPSIGNIFFAVWGQNPEPYVFQMPTLKKKKKRFTFMWLGSWLGSAEPMLFSQWT